MIWQKMSMATVQEVAWGLFGLSVEEMRERLRADLVAAHAEIFLINGDINSNLYTSTRAMHSAIIGLLQVPHLDSRFLNKCRTKSIHL